MLYAEVVGPRQEPVRNVVERGAILRFAEAIADPSPLHVDEDVVATSRAAMGPILVRGLARERSATR